MWEFSRCPPAVPDYSNLVRGPMGSPAGLDDSCQVRGPAGLTSCPGYSGLCPRSRRVDQQYRATRALSNGPPCRSAVPGDSGPYLRSRRVDQLSLTTRTHVRVLEVSNRCPRLLTIRSYGLRYRPAVRDDCGLSQTSHEIDELSQMIQDRVQWPAVLTHCPGDSGPCPSAHGVDQQSRENPACAGAPMVSTSCPGRLGTVTKVSRCRSDFLGDSGPDPRRRGFELLSRAIRAKVFIPVGLTSCPGRLALGCKGPRCRPAVLDDSGLGQSCRDVDQLSQTIHDRVHGVDQQSQETRDSEQRHSVAIRFPRLLGPESVAPRV